MGLEKVQISKCLVSKVMVTFVIIIWHTKVFNFFVDKLGTLCFRLNLDNNL
jgi:hypothetical protein